MQHCQWVSVVDDQDTWPCLFWALVLLQQSQAPCCGGSTHALPPTSGGPGPTYLRPISCPRRFWWRKPQSVVFSLLDPKPEPHSIERPLPAQPRVRPCHLCALYCMPVVVLSVHPYLLAGAWHQQQEAEELHCSCSVDSHSASLDIAELHHQIHYVGSSACQTRCCCTWVAGDSPAGRAADSSAARAVLMHRHCGYPQSVCEAPASRRARWYGYLLYVQVLLVVAHSSWDLISIGAFISDV